MRELKPVRPLSCPWAVGSVYIVQYSSDQSLFPAVKI